MRGLSEQQCLHLGEVLLPLELQVLGHISQSQYYYLLAQDVDLGRERLYVFGPHSGFLGIGMLPAAFLVGSGSGVGESERLALEHERGK